MSLEVIDRLIELDAEAPKRIAVLGDALVDVWAEGEAGGSQDGCPCFRQTAEVRTPGGAAGAARQLFHWRSEAKLIAPLGYRDEAMWALAGVNTELAFLEGSPPIKTRLVHGGKIVFRHDREERPSENAALHEQRELALRTVREMNFDAVLISDYDKGFLSEELIREAATFCRLHKIPVVCDAKRRPGLYGGVLKCNAEYAERFRGDRDFSGLHVVTQGAGWPLVAVGDFVGGLRPGGQESPRQAAVDCVNHVGAGDCFAAHLTLALAHGLPLGEAAAVAHAAGRVYVQHPHGRPPWPHEIRKDTDPVGGKNVSAALIPALRLSCPRPVVFTNGVFRVPTAAHCENLRWAKAQGATLVVGVNDDVSAFRARRGDFCLPLAERLEMLASLACVDYVVPFSEDTPRELCLGLRPDVLAKGPEEAGTQPPGGEHAGEVRFHPGGQFAARHATTIIKEIRGA